MRVSSLSDDRVIDLVSRYFVPALLSRDHYQRSFKYMHGCTIERGPYRRGFRQPVGKHGFGFDSHEHRGASGGKFRIIRGYRATGIEQYQHNNHGVIRR